jgi:hypothetical protein
MDIWFLPFIVAHVFWVPWNFIFARQLCAAKTSSRDRNR